MTSPQTFYPITITLTYGDQNDHSPIEFLKDSLEIEASLYDGSDNLLATFRISPLLNCTSPATHISTSLLSLENQSLILEWQNTLIHAYETYSSPTGLMDTVMSECPATRVLMQEVPSLMLRNI